MKATNILHHLAAGAVAIALVACSIDEPVKGATAGATSSGEGGASSSVGGATCGTAGSGTEGALLTRPVDAGTVGPATVDDAPHGPSHIPLIAAQWSAAIAMGTKIPQRATTTIATVTRRPFMTASF